MRILVVGAGATGGYFGGRLALAGRDVTFLLRERRQQQLKQTGLILQTPQGEHVLQPKTLVAQEIDGTYDVILIAVKSFGLVQAIEDITPAVGPDTRIIPLLNGMRHIDMLRGRFGENNVTGGLCKINATLGPQGEIIQMTPLHQLYYGALDGNNDSRLQHIDRELSHCGFDTILCEDIITDLWEKWLLLSTLGAVTCLARGDTRQVLMSSGGSTLLQGVFSEVLATLAAEGYRERPANTAAIYATLSNQKTPMTSSMYRDMVQGNDVEAGQIIGDLAQRAERHHLAVPLLNAVWVHMQVYLQQRHTPSEK